MASLDGGWKEVIKIERDIDALTMNKGPPRPD